LRAEAIHGDDIGMIERGCSPCFLLKTPQPVGIGSQLLWQQLKRDLTPQALVAGPVHLTHGSRTQRCQDFAVPELGSRGDGHRSRNYSGGRTSSQFWNFSRRRAKLSALWMLRRCGITPPTQFATGNQSVSAITWPWWRWLAPVFWSHFLPQDGPLLPILCFSWSHSRYWRTSLIVRRTWSMSSFRCPVSANSGGPIAGCCFSSACRSLRF